jgi:hypothetical protein
MLSLFAFTEEMCVELVDNSLENNVHIPHGWYKEHYLAECPLQKLKE